MAKNVETKYGVDNIFNFRENIGDGQHDGSVALSDIEFPSHISELESFQSEFDNTVTVHSNDSLSSSHPQQEFQTEQQFEPRKTSAEGSEVSSLPDLPEQAEENVNLFLAALKAATVQDKSKESDEGSNHGHISDVSNSSSNLDSYRFISKESFPDSVLAESSQSWGKELSLNPDDLLNLPSSTPFCGEPPLENDQSRGLDSRLSEKFLAPSKTPENGSNIESEGNGTNPWSFSGTSMFLQTPANDNQVKTDNTLTRETLKKPKDQNSFSSTLQKKLWADSLSVNNKTFEMEGESFEHDPRAEKIINPFDNSNVGLVTSPNNGVEDPQNPFESNDAFSFNQDLDDFSFQSAGEAAKRLDKDEEEFVSTQVFDQEVDIVDNTMFSDYVLPGSSSRTGRRSVIGINDPDNKGEVRVSFGKFFGTKTEELGSLNGEDKNRPRPQFESGPCSNKSPEAAPPRPLYRPSFVEGSEDETSSPRQMARSLEPSQPKPNEAKQRVDLHDKQKEMDISSVTRSLPYGAEDETKGRDNKCKGDGDTDRGKKGYTKDIGTLRAKIGQKEDKDKTGQIQDTRTIRDNEGYTEHSKRIRDKVGCMKKRGTNANIEEITEENETNKEGYNGTDRDKQGHTMNRGTARDKKDQRDEKKGPDAGSRFRRISSIDPNDSTMAALQFCQSSEGSKLMSMSTNELKLLSRTLAKVTQGEPAEIYKVLVMFINRRKSRSKSRVDENVDSMNFSDVFSEKNRASSESVTIRDRPGSPDDTDGLTFYHSDTSCDVSPSASSKFEPLLATVSSPPLDTSSPKSTGNSIAIQTESRDSGLPQESSVPKCTSITPSITSHPSRSTNMSPSTSTFGETLPGSLPLQSSATSNGFQVGSSVGGIGSTTAGMIGRARDIAGSTGSISSTGGITGDIPNIVTATSHGDLVANQNAIPARSIPGRVVSLSREGFVSGATYTSLPTIHPVPETIHHVPRTVYSPSEAVIHKPGVHMTRMPLVQDQRIPPPQLPPPFAGSQAVFHNASPVWSGTSTVQPFARTTPHQHGFLQQRQPDLRLRPASVTDDGGLPTWGGDDTKQPGLSTWSGHGTRQPGLPAWTGGDGAKPTGQRPEAGWNWRTDHTSEIQMVIPPTLDFPGVLCVGLSAEALLPIHNPTTRWIRCSSVIIRCTLNGIEVDPQHDSSFLIRESTLIGPKLTENVKVEFKCVVAGIYVAEMKVISIPVGSDGSDHETSSAVVTIQGFSEYPYLEIFTEKGQTLDFGEVHEGYNGMQSFRVVNKGRTAIPLKMLICSSSSPGIYVFSKRNAQNQLKDLEVNNNILKCLLPASNDLIASPESLTIWVELVGKNYHCFKQADEAELFSAVINIQLDTGSIAKILGNISVQGVIGVTKIQIPKAFQMAMCLSSQVGQKVSRQLPFSNSGNICANVQLSIPKYREMFTAIPDKFLINPGKTVTVEVGFCPRVKDSCETVLQVSEVAYNKSYEVLLRGSSVDQQSTKDEGATALLSNKSWLSWTGVDIGKAVHKRLFLLNDSSEQFIQFNAFILGEHADFEIQRMKCDFTKGGNSSEKITLRPKERIPIYVLFAPSSFGVFKSALVLNQTRGPRFKVPLYAYGGTSNLSIYETDGIKKTSDGYDRDLGQVSLGHRNIVKLTVKNTGSRSAFVKAICFADHQIRLHYPKTHLSIVPSEFVLPERSSKELVVVFQPLQHDAQDCQSNVKRVASIVLYYGDEVLRQWYKRNLSKQHDLDGRRTTGNIKFDDVGFNKSFQDENCFAEDFDFPDLDDFEEIFNNHVSQVFFHLLGGPEKDAEQQTGTVGATAADEDTSSVVMATPRAKHVTEPRTVIRCETPAQNEDGGRKNMVEETVNNELTSWSLIPERLSLKVPVKGTMDSTKKVQLLNYTNRPLEFEFSWPAHCIAVTPHVGTIPAKNQSLIHVSVWSSISSAGIELPWSGTAYVNCDGTRKALAIQIHKHLQSDDSPAPSVINKPLSKLDSNKVESPSYKMPFKPQKQDSPLTITPKVVTFARTEVGKASVSVVTIENVSSSPVRWKISSVAPAYAKVSDTSEELLRASYAVFRFSSYTGLIRPGQKTQIEVEFRTRDVGVYCQIWDLQTNPESPLTSTKTQIELSGKTVLPETTREKKRLSEPIRGTKSVVTINPVDKEKKESANALVKSDVYCESDDVEFPDTAVGKTSLVKIKLCNKSAAEHQFGIISSQPAFTLKRPTNVSIKSGHFLKVPVYFSPKEPSSHYSAVVSFENSSSGEILSVNVHGKSCKK